MKNNITQNPTMVKVLTRVSTFYRTNQSMWFYVTSMLIIFAIELILFVCGLLAINGIEISDEHAWKAWLLILIPGFGATCGFVGGVYAVRGDTRFLGWILIQTTAFVITDFFSHSWLVGSIFFLQIFITIIRYIQWREHMKLGAGEKPESMLTFKNILIVVLIALFVFSFGVILVTNDSIRESMYFDNQTDKWTPTYLIVIDVVSSTCLITAIMLMNLKTRWTFAFFMINKVFILIIFASHHNLVMVAQTILFWTMDFSGLLAWTANPPTRPREKHIKSV